MKNGDILSYNDNALYTDNALHFKPKYLQLAAFETENTDSFLRFQEDKPCRR